MVISVLFQPNSSYFIIRGGWPAGLITISSVYLVYIVELILVLNMFEISAAGR